MFKYKNQDLINEIKDAIFEYEDYATPIEIPLIDLNKYLNMKNIIIEVLEIKYNKRHFNGGRKSKITIEQKLDATIEYCDEKANYKNIAKKYGIHESNMYDNINWVISSLKDLNFINAYKITEFKKQCLWIKLDKIKKYAKEKEQQNV